MGVLYYELRFLSILGVQASSSCGSDGCSPARSALRYCAGGKPGFLFEHTAEIQRVIIPDDLGNFTDAVFGAFQQALCIDDTQRLDIPCGRQAHILFEATDEPCRAHVQGLGVFIHIDAGSIILVKIGGCGFDLPRVVPLIDRRSCRWRLTSTSIIWNSPAV